MQMSFADFYEGGSEDSNFRRKLESRTSKFGFDCLGTRLHMAFKMQLALMGFINSNEIRPPCINGADRSCLTLHLLQSWSAGIPDLLNFLSSPKISLTPMRIFLQSKQQSNEVPIEYGNSRNRVKISSYHGIHGANQLQLTKEKLNSLELIIFKYLCHLAQERSVLNIPFWTK